MTNVLLNEVFGRIASGKDKGSISGSEDKRAAWESRAAKIAAIIRLAMADEICSHDTTEELLKDSVASW